MCSDSVVRAGSRRTFYKIKSKGPMISFPRFLTKNYMKAFKKSLKKTNKKRTHGPYSTHTWIKSPKQKQKKQFKKRKKKVHWGSKYKFVAYKLTLWYPTPSVPHGKIHVRSYHLSDGGPLACSVNAHPVLPPDSSSQGLEHTSHHYLLCPTNFPCYHSCLTRSTAT